MCGIMGIGVLVLLVLFYCVLLFVFLFFAYTVNYIMYRGGHNFPPSRHQSPNFENISTSQLPYIPHSGG